MSDASGYYNKTASIARRQLLEEQARRLAERLQRLEAKAAHREAVRRLEAHARKLHDEDW